jgi:uncharacterized membrane protein YfcA
LTGWQSLLLVPAGLVAGLVGSVAGLASLVSYPALLAVGLGPISANVTNTVALVFSSVGSVTASGPELHGQRAQVLRVAAMSALGGLAGGLLLISTPSGAFARLVPWLIGLGSVVVRRAPAAVLRPVIALVGLGLAAYLAVRAYR